MARDNTPSELLQALDIVRGTTTGPQLESLDSPKSLKSGESVKSSKTRTLSASASAKGVE